MPKVSVSYPSPLNQYGKRKESYGISTFADEYIPFPRTNGARFCGNGKYIYVCSWNQCRMRDTVMPL